MMPINIGASAKTKVPSNDSIGGLDFFQVLFCGIDKVPNEEMVSLLSKFKKPFETGYFS